MKNAFSVGLYIKLFQIAPYADNFQTFNNPGSGQPVGALKNPPFLTQVILNHHRRRRRHHHHRVVRVTVAPLRDP